MNKQLTKKTLVVLAFLLPLATILLLVSKSRENQKREAIAFRERAESAFAKWEREHAAQMVAIAGVDFKLVLTNISSTTSLTSAQREELLTVIEGFYKCYADGTFDAFRAYRLSLPFELDTNTVANLRFCLPSNLRPPRDKMDVLENLWNYYVSTNRILRIDPASIRISVEELTDKQQGIYAKATNYVAEAAIGYLPRVVVPHPTAKEIFQHDRRVVHATVEQFIVSSANPRSVDPLFVSFYWVENLGRWLPYEVAKITGDFRILF